MGCTTRVQFPAYDIRVTPSADLKADLHAIDDILKSEQFEPHPTDRNIGHAAILPCVGHMEFLSAYRLTDATGVYVGRLDDGRISVTLTDTAKLGAAFTADDRAKFSHLAEKLTHTFGATRVAVPAVWGDAYYYCDGPSRPISALD